MHHVQNHKSEFEWPYFILRRAERDPHILHTKSIPSSNDTVGLVTSVNHGCVSWVIRTDSSQTNLPRLHYLCIVRKKSGLNLVRNSYFDGHPQGVYCHTSWDRTAHIHHNLNVWIENRNILRTVGHFWNLAPYVRRSSRAPLKSQRFNAEYAEWLR